MLRLFIRFYGILFATLAFSFLAQMPLVEYVAGHLFTGSDREGGRLVAYAVHWSVELLVVAVLVGFWIRPFRRELLSLLDAVEHAGQGRLDVAPQVGRRSVLRELADALTRMTAQIGLLLQSHRALTSAVSHELRAPLARLRFIHSLAREERTAEGKERLLARMEEDIAEIEALTSELLEYARLERGTPELDQQTLPVASWLEDIVANARVPGFASVTIQLRTDLAFIRCDPRYMGRALSNLLRNAFAHADASVRVSVTQADAMTVIHVDDDGPGIAPRDRERLFEPFERAEGDRDTGGIGLGLAIVRQVARWHGGEALLSESPLGGARASIRW